MKIYQIVLVCAIIVSVTSMSILKKRNAYPDTYEKKKIKGENGYNKEKSENVSELEVENAMDLVIGFCANFVEISENVRF